MAQSAVKDGKGCGLRNARAESEAIRSPLIWDRHLEIDAAEIRMRAARELDEAQADGEGDSRA